MKKKVLVIGVTVVASEILWQLYKYVRSRYVKWNDSKTFTKVMFFTKESALCRPHLITEKPCSKPNCPVRHISRIIYHIRNAQSSVRVCLYFLTCSPLCDALIEAHKRGISVKIILDSHLTDSSLARAHEFYKAGIPVTISEGEELMHHKFAIIDNKIVITGSLNWTAAGFFGNFENAIVTNYRSIVEPFNVEFEKIWGEFAVSSSGENSLSHYDNVTYAKFDEDLHNKLDVTASPHVPHSSAGTPLGADESTPRPKAGGRPTVTAAIVTFRDVSTMSSPRIMEMPEFGLGE